MVVGRVRQLLVLLLLLLEVVVVVVVVRKDGIVRLCETNAFVRRVLGRITVLRRAEDGEKGCRVLRFLFY